MANESDRLRNWQGVTLGTLFVGYMGYYVCRSNLSIAAPMMLDDYRDQGLTKKHLGDVAALGVILYVIGKSLNGVLTEYLGGKRIFVFGMLASALFSVLIALSPMIAPDCDEFARMLGLPLAILLPLYILWCSNRFVQSMGWGGLVQIASRWFHPNRMATVMGFLCMSYLLGDALARGYLGQVTKLFQLNWQGLFYLSAGTLFVLAIVTAILLRGRPSLLGLPEPPPPPGNVYGDDDGSQRISVFMLMKPLLTSSAFWIICIMNAGLTLIRESFNFWTPTYLTEVVKSTPEDAGTASLVFPLCGAVAAMVCGWLVDRRGGRFGAVVFGSLILTVAALVAMALVDVKGHTGLALAMIGVVALGIMGPYSFCSGVLAVKLGGQRAGATSAGVIDSVGYIGGALGVSGIGRIATRYGWEYAFTALAGIAILTLLVAALAFRDAKPVPSKP